MTLLPNSKSKIAENYKVNNIGWRCIKMYITGFFKQDFKSHIMAGGHLAQTREKYLILEPSNTAPYL